MAESGIMGKMAQSYLFHRIDLHDFCGQFGNIMQILYFNFTVVSLHSVCWSFHIF